jgi:DNA-binding transcriptional ArsR family regulator
MPDSKYLQRREALVCFVRAYLFEYGYTPSPTILSQALGWPASTCQDYLRRLRKEILLPSSSFSNRKRFLAHRQQILELIQEFNALHGYSPSLRWLAVESGLSPTTLGKYLRILREQGLVDFDERVSRSIRLV